ncbi:TPA: NAD(P)/FAD-dependent oxidoreductase [Candidatus Poribacteria bacterium]|nr:NAD(P)/FAD-dependent oxidoreductase [Candidatus Poribacteria bacterium]
MRYVIIGNSAAAIGAIESIRKVDRENDVLVISAERYMAYSRPLISELLAGETTPHKMLYRPPEFYKLNDVELMLGRKVVGLNLRGKKVILEDGEEIGYDKLLIATGSHPFLPPMEGTDLKGVHTFFTLDDAIAVMEMARKVKQAVVIGGGFIGLKAAESLKERGIRVTVVELAQTVMSTALDESAARIVEEHMRGEGVKIITGNAVQRIYGVNSYVTGVELRDGTKIPCGLVIVSVGVRANSQFAKEAGIQVNRGIVVDDRMRTSAPDVYAAGDVAEGKDILLGTLRGLPLWPVAYRMGKTAGYNMAGGDYPYKGGFAMNSVSIFGLPIISMGITTPSGGDGFRVLIRADMDKKIYRKLVLRENRLVGAVFINSVDRAGIANGFIRDGTDVGDIAEKMLDDDFTLALMPESWRKVKLSA